MKINEDDNQFISMTNLAKILGASDWRTAMKWCDENNLPIMPIGSNKMTFKFMAEAVLDRLAIQSLKIQYPKKWDTLFKHYKNKDHLEYVLEIEQDIKTPIKTNKKVTPISRFAKKFASD